MAQTLTWKEYGRLGKWGSGPGSRVRSEAFCSGSAELINSSHYAVLVLEHKRPCAGRHTNMRV
jgi:hypothetical protein